METSLRATRAEINSQNFYANLAYFQSRLELGEKSLANSFSSSRLQRQPARLCLVVKANAYGHGLQELSLRAQALDGCVSAFAISTTEEGSLLRQAGINLPILLLSPHLRDEIPLLFDNALEPMVSHEYYLQAYQREAEKRQQALRLHLKVDTGMGRGGVLYSEATALVQKISQFNGLQLHGLCTHFASADSDEPVARQDTELQLECFLRVQRQLQEQGVHFVCVHAANSAATLHYPQAHFDMVRVGIGAYGYCTGAPELLPVMSLKSKIGLVKTVPRGHKVSYGGTWQAQRDSVLGLLPLGYADGYSRLLSKQGQVLLLDELCPILGQVCMDQVVIDLSDFVLRHPEFSAERLLEQDVELFGAQPELNAQHIARQTSTIPYEVLTSISARVSRVYID